MFGRGSEKAIVDLKWTISELNNFIFDIQRIYETGKYGEKNLQNMTLQMLSPWLSSYQHTSNTVDCIEMPGAFLIRVYDPYS
jgi:hypothetical protein